MIKMRLALSRLRDVFVDLLHHLDHHGDDDKNIGDGDGVPTSLSEGAIAILMKKATTTMEIKTS